MTDPVIACTLPVARLPGRLTDFADLFAAHLAALDRRSPTHLRIELVGADPAWVVDLLARERACCAFFDFALSRPAAGRLAVDARVPPSGAEVLDELARLAGAPAP